MHIGEFILPQRHFNREGYSPAARELLKNVSIVKASYDVVQQGLLIEGISDVFDDVPPSNTVPRYDVLEEAGTLAFVATNGPLSMAMRQIADLNQIISILRKECDKKDKL